MSKEKDINAEIQALTSKLTGDALTDMQIHSAIYELRHKKRPMREALGIIIPIIIIYLHYVLVVKSKKR